MIRIVLILRLQFTVHDRVPGGRILGTLVTRENYLRTRRGDDKRDRDGYEEEQEPHPSGVIASPPLPKPNESAREEQEREPGAGDDDRRRIPRRGELPH